MEKLKNTLEISNEVDIIYTLIALFLCIICSLILKIVYEEKSTSLSNKSQLSNIIPILSIATFLVISVVKSSLALSLGLVGALSIVRFRTPIKDPEELVYLFLAISLGLGFGSGQIIITIIIYFTIVLFIWFYLSRKKINSSSDYNLIIESQDENQDLMENSEFIKNTLSESFGSVIFVKYDKIGENKDIMIFKISLNNLDNVKNFQKKLKTKLNNYNISLFENNTLI
mgnify:FL=1|tara:strand:- start:219 stop:902 length:684 start_codon:yes stop_codon:yes gene_type:complete